MNCILLIEILAHVSTRAKEGKIPFDEYLYINNLFRLSQNNIYYRA